MRTIVFGYHQKAAGIFINPMDNSRPNDPIDSGKIEIDGVNISRQPEYKRAKYIGRVFQDPMKGTAAGMEIQENMALAFRRGQKRGLGWGIRANEKDYYHDLLTRLGLGLQNRMSSKVGLLSGGQRQALTLLMATLQKPKLLLLDEHTAALDPQTARKVILPSLTVASTATTEASLSRSTSPIWRSLPVSALGTLAVMPFRPSTLWEPKRMRSISPTVSLAL